MSAGISYAAINAEILRQWVPVKRYPTPMVNSNPEDLERIKELEDINDLLEDYFRNTIIPQLFVDADLILRKFTPPAMRQFDFTPSHIGKPISELVDNIRFSTILEDISAVIKSGEILEKEIQTSDMCWFQMNIIPYQVRRLKKLNGVIITFVDITDRIKNLRELEKLNASHETFIYSVSHDLRAPLNNIEGLVDNLLESSAEIATSVKEITEEQNAIAAMLNKSVKVMRNIINELTDIARIDGNFREKTERINVEKMLHEVEMTIKDRITENKAKLTYNIQEPEIEFSLKNLRSIIYNLVSNAIKYRSPDRAPQVTVSTRRENDFVLISVKDNGAGISEEKQDEIFSRFTRLSNSTDGMGIGLYLVRKIIENAGGKIVVNSTPGQGSEFVVHLKAKK